MKKNLLQKIIAGVALSSICMTTALAVPASATKFYASEEPMFGNYFNSDYETRAEVIQANRDLNEYIGHLPDGFDTPLMRIFEEDGIELSIGQWQKLAILLKDTHGLIM